MKCKKIEKLLFRSLDERLKGNEEHELEEHIANCPLCQKVKKEYQLIFETLRGEKFPETKPYFWQRLQPRLKEYRKYEPWFLWKRWSIRAIPLSLLIVVMLAGAILLLVPPRQEELSPSEILLLSNSNPLQETQTILEQEGIENKSMMLIFTALEEKK